MSDSATIHTIAPGLSLVITTEADHDLVERITAMLDRGATVDSIVDDVQHLTEHADVSGLEHVMLSTGFMNNRVRTTCAELSAAIMALLPVLSLDRLLQVYETARFESARSLGSRRRAAVVIDMQAVAS